MPHLQEMDFVSSSSASSSSSSSSSRLVASLIWQEVDFFEHCGAVMTDVLRDDPMASLYTSPKDRRGGPINANRRPSLVDLRMPTWPTLVT